MIIDTTSFLFSQRKLIHSIKNKIMKVIVLLDQDQRNIIDKLANFVARNGPQFEELTKEKQRANPKFQFLYGGDYHAYYKWKVHLEGDFAFVLAVDETEAH